MRVRLWAAAFLCGHGLPRYGALPLLLVLLLGWTGRAAAQGVQTGTIRGTVVDTQALAIPGVTVSVTSAALQGQRTAVTDATGNYAILALPPGDYQVTFELTGFGTVMQHTTVLLGLTSEQNVTMRPATVTESVEVVAQTPAPIASPTIGANFTHDEIDALATPRTLQGIATLSPSLTEASPNTDQVVINGAFAFDNNFMVNGVDVTDNLFGTPQDLFIEDAIQETQVLTSGISAEYGRFSGGVVNAVTKSGGNRFEGSYRLNLQNPAWTQETPFDVSKGIEYRDTLQHTQEATLGGPILRDRLWFFGSGRLATVTSPVTLQFQSVQLDSVSQNRRGEIKFTGTPWPSQTLQFDFLNDPTTVTNNSGVQPLLIDPHAEVDRGQANHYWVTNYKGVVHNLLLEAQISQRKFAFINDGGTSTNLLDSPFTAVSCQCFYNAPYFDATDPTKRNNYQATADVTKFWTGGGSHDTKFGYEFFRSQEVGGNSQSSTGYVFESDFATDASGNAVLDANGRVIPIFIPGVSEAWYFPAVRGATKNVDNNSSYVQDHWAVNRHISTDLGARFEQVKITSTGNITSINTSPRVVPRLALSYDPRGDGHHVVHVTYAHYSGRYNENYAGNSPVGSPSEIDTVYTGPEGQGVGFGPGFDLANYPISTANYVNVPIANVISDTKAKSPLTKEFTTSYGLNIKGGRGYAEAGYVHRRTNNVIEDVIDTTTGITNVVLNGVDAGPATNILYTNSDVAFRVYDALTFQSRYRITDRWSVNGNYTLQLRNDGNFEGEGSNQPASRSAIGDYPEALPANRYYPAGHLFDFERHRLRAWTVYDVHMGGGGDISLSGLWRVDSGRTFSYLTRNTGPTATQAGIEAAAGYPTPSGAYNVYYADRGTGQFAGYGLFDTSIQYTVPVFKSLRPWARFDVYNLFNNQKLIAWNTTIAGDKSGPKDQYGIPTTYIPGAAFGTATGDTVTNGSISGIPAYPQWVGGSNGGRTIRMAIGFRF